jgi:sugar phosphate isomerase/epimerase
MRLGAPVFADCSDPEKWVSAVKAAGYSADYCPVDENADDATVSAYAEAAGNADIVIAEVGAWSNPLSPDEEQRRAALKLCRDRLALADRIGARCCVNIAGSLGEKWDGPCPEDLTSDAFDLIVESVRDIIDGVQPARADYTLELMPWMYPDSPESNLELIRAIDRERFAVHLDPVNIVCSPQRYFNNAGLLRECFELLGPYIRSCHAKDIVLGNQLTVHLDETCPGQGGLDYATYLRELSKLDADTPLMLEHMTKEEDYVQGAAHIRSVAEAEGLAFL